MGNFGKLVEFRPVLTVRVPGTSGASTRYFTVRVPGLNLVPVRTKFSMGTDYQPRKFDPVSAQFRSHQRNSTWSIRAPGIPLIFSGIPNSTNFPKFMLSYSILNFFPRSEYGGRSYCTSVWIVLTSTRYSTSFDFAVPLEIKSTIQELWVLI